MRRIQLLMENWSIALPLSSERLTEGNLEQIMVQTPSCAKMEGKEWGGISTNPPHSHTPSLLCCAVDKAEARSKPRSSCGWIKAGNHCLQESTAWQLSQVPIYKLLILVTKAGSSQPTQTSSLYNFRDLLKKANCKMGIQYSFLLTRTESPLL